MVLSSLPDDISGSRDRPLYGANWRRVLPLAIASDPGAPRKLRSIHGTSVRGHESMRYTCEASDDHAEGHSAGKENQGGLGWSVK